MLGPHGLWQQSVVKLNGAAARVGGWGKQEAASQVCAEGRVSGELTPAARWVGMEGGLVSGHAKSFRLFKQCLPLKSQCTISSFSLGGTTCLAYILFNDSGNSSFFNHFLIRYAFISSILSHERPYVYPLKMHPGFKKAPAFPFSKSYLKSCK